MQDPAALPTPRSRASLVTRTTATQMSPISVYPENPQYPAVPCSAPPSTFVVPGTAASAKVPPQVVPAAMSPCHPRPQVIPPQASPFHVRALGPTPPAPGSLTPSTAPAPPPPPPPASPFFHHLLHRHSRLHLFQHLHCPLLNHLHHHHQLTPPSHDPHTQQSHHR